MFTITVGDCFDDQGGSTVTDVPVVPCGTPHDYEVYADFTIPDADSYPGDDVIDQQADAGCEDTYQGFVGIAYDDSVYGYTYFTPTETSWTNNGDRLVSCLIGDPNGNKTTGTLEGAAK